MDGVAWVLYTAFPPNGASTPPEAKPADAIQVTLVDLHLRKDLPKQTKYNGAQRIAYTSCIVLGALILLSGGAIYKPTSAHWLTSSLGG